MHEEYLTNLYNRLLEHRYRYYILCEPALSDAEYDYLEKFYNDEANKACVKQMDMVDFDINDPLAIEAAKRVDSKTDYYSLWLAEMKPVWDKLGRAAKDVKNGKK